MLKNCKRCKKTFVANDKLSFVNYCNSCFNTINKEIDLLNTSLKSNTNLTLDDLHIESGISKTRIKEYIRSGKVSSTYDFGIAKCVKCGRQIKSGTICGACISTKKYD